MKPQTSWGMRARGGEEGDKEIESHLPGSQETLYFLHLIELHELLVSSKIPSLQGVSVSCK